MVVFSLKQKKWMSGDQLGTKEHNKMQNPQFILLIQRDGNADHDEVIRISKNNNGSYTVYYDDKEDHRLVPRTVFLSEIGVCEYVTVVLQALGSDRDPSPCIQMMPPAAPSIIYTHKQLGDREIREQILDMLRLSIRNWPMYVRPVQRTVDESDDEHVPRYNTRSVTSRRT
jgi:hypothetical protein